MFELFCPRPHGTPRRSWIGSVSAPLSLAIAAVQVLLDRGEQLDWFSSREIAVEGVIGAAALYLFLVHTFTAREPFVRPSLFRDRNFAAGTLFIAIVGLTYYASLALQPPFSPESHELPDRQCRHGDGAARRRHDGPPCWSSEG